MELELPSRKQSWLDAAYKFSSARAAFDYLVERLELNEVWLPNYLCNTMITAVLDETVELKFYNLTQDFAIKKDLNLSANSALLYVNYFGLCTEQANEVITQYGADRVIVDNSQAFFSEPFDALATIYSPRKFFGLPDGGLLFSDDSRMKQPSQRDCSSNSRMKHLISRLTNNPEESYQQYLEAEAEIGQLQAKGMSLLTERLLYSIDYERARDVRFRNAQYLHEQLSKYNQLELNIDENISPLCYPYLPNVKTKNKEELIQQRIFIPTYWPEVLSRVKETSFEWSLVTDVLFLPCDQRYTEDDMERIINLLTI